MGSGPFPRCQLANHCFATERVCRNQEFRENPLPLPNQRVTIPVRYDRNLTQNRSLGYARVSTYGQTLDAQLERLRGAGCTKIYREKVTGAHRDRRELLKMLHALAPGDVVTVTRVDRLARSTFDLFGIVKRIMDAKAQFRSLAESWADTGTGRLMLAVLGGLADVERDLIRARTAEGRSRAKAQGKAMGRSPLSQKTPAQQKEATARRAQGARLQELADNYDRSISTMRRATRDA